MRFFSQLDQRPTNLCHTFACFGILSCNFKRSITNKDALDWVSKHGIKNEGNQARFIAKIIADESKGKIEYVEFAWGSPQMYEAAKKWGVHIGTTCPNSFWKDAIDGDIDSYDHSLIGKGHSSYFFFEGGKYWLINSFGKLLPPLEFDPKKMKRRWIHAARVFTLIPT